MDNERNKRMDKALKEIHKKNQSKKAKRKRAKKKAWWKRMLEGG